MKILILATDIFAPGGIARYTWTLASALGEVIGPENVEVLALLGAGETGGAGGNFRMLDAIGRRPAPAAKLRFTARALLAGGRGYDLAVCSHVCLAPVAAMNQRLHGTPYWVACHDAEVWDRLRPSELAALRRAELALPVSRFTAEQLRVVNGVPAERIRVLGNAIPDDMAALLASTSGAAEACEPPMPAVRYILSVGSLAKEHAYKGFDTVIRALPRVVERVPELACVIAGDGDNRPQLESLARRVGVGEQVVFAGRVSQRQLAAYYRGCDAFVMPSRTGRERGQWHGEGFGRVYVEAALAARPVVGSSEGGAAEAVVHGRTGLLVNPASHAEVADALLLLLGNPGLAAAMGRAGRRWAQRHFTQAALRVELAQMLRAREQNEVRR